MGKKYSKKDSGLLKLIVTVNGVILGFSITFFAAWSNFGNSDPWTFNDLKVLIPIWLGQLVLSSGLFFGLYPKKILKKSTVKNFMFWSMIVGILLIFLATIICVIINFKK
jgi:hypothetical protein